MKNKKFLQYTTVLLSLLLPTLSWACGSDAECANGQICNDSGQCVVDGNDWETLLLELSESFPDDTKENIPDYTKEDVLLVDTLMSELGGSETKSCTTQSCKSCRQSARYRFSACLRVASNDSAKSQCSSNFQAGKRQCRD